SKLDVLVRADPGQCAGAAGVQHQSGVTWIIAGRLAVEHAFVVQLLYLSRGDGEFRHARPAGIDRKFGPVLLSFKADRRGLDPHWQVLADKDHVVALIREAARDRQDPRVVVAQPEPGGQNLRIDVVELHARGAAERSDRNLGIEAPVRDLEAGEVPERQAGEDSQLGLATLTFTRGL